jgi:hypothetical protein
MELSTAKVRLTSAATAGKMAETFDATTSDPKNDGAISWRMVYDAKKIHALFQATGRTYTRANLFCAETKEECLAKAKALGMEVPVEVMNQGTPTEL